MTIEEILNAISEGASPEEVAILQRQLSKDTVKAKAQSWKAQAEVDAQMRQFQVELDGDAASGRLGLRAYQKWYEENKGELAKYNKWLETQQQQPPTPQTPPNQGPTMTSDQINALVQQRLAETLQTQYGPKWSELLTSTGTLVQKHMFAGRKEPIDFQTVNKLAMEKFGGNLEMAYDEWDKPTREKEAKEAQEKEIQRRVNEEIQRRGVSQNFPGAADFTASESPISPKSKDDFANFDKVKLTRELAAGWATAGQP